ncbi:kinase-like domain-containing protein [Glomus cerebriforme]|uniref:Kinase-like domain-containing protein n=1 Tax=Glomus cerebriforme TaxID=658196 RepID=A0A397T797_9GLOM|nr:kinase-like domain-containing protein [Glomus cerebriforme]
MNQSSLEEKKINRICPRCKQINTEQNRWCRTCYLNYNEKRYGRCIECEQINTGENWCQPCNSKRFQQNFDNWTGGNDDVDKFLQNIQLSAKNSYQILEWIPYDKFCGVEHVADGGFGKVYKANWKGYISHWDMSIHNWKRHGQHKFVTLKSLNSSRNITLEFINEITLHVKIYGNKLLDQHIIRCYGISQNPETKDYIMVMQYAKKGSYRNYLDIKKPIKVKNQALDIKWDKMKQMRHKTYNLSSITAGLKKIHEEGLIHRDLHIGNIVCFRQTTCITDMGLCKPANYNELENNIYGVLAYVAPEILRGQPYTKASDIYSLGIIMYEIISELSPYHDVAHDQYLAIMICKGLRPKFNSDIPKLILHTIKRCLDANPLNRPTAKELSKITFEWKDDINKYMKNIRNQKESTKTELINQIEASGIINDSSSTNSLTNKLHHEAIYTSRVLNFNNLPEPKNSHDYYKDYNNISNIKYSEPEFS